MESLLRLWNDTGIAHIEPGQAFMMLVGFGMLYHCGTEAAIEEHQTRRRIAYETRDDATIKTFDDDLELEKKRTNRNQNQNHDEENPASSEESHTHTNSMTEQDDSHAIDEIIVNNNDGNDGKTEKEPSESSQTETPPSMIIVDIEMDSTSTTSENDDHDDDIAEMADIERGEETQ